MNSIVIFILFVVVSMIFQAFKQEGNRTRQQASPRPNRPTMQPTVAPHRSPSDQNINKMQSNREQPSTSAVKKTPMNAEVITDPEGVQTEGPIRGSLLQSKKLDEASARESSFLDIDINDLQRSIVMSEILSKPKSLRKN